VREQWKGVKRKRRAPEGKREKEGVSETDRVKE
jgi:hypothetical protein